jgi:hypothetical protein
MNILTSTQVDQLRILVAAESLITSGVQDAPTSPSHNVCLVVLRDDSTPPAIGNKN